MAQVGVRVNKYDGDGRLVRTANGSTPTGYYLYSSVTGLAVAKLNGNGQRIETYVYAGGRRLATAHSYSGVLWSHSDPVTGSHGLSEAGGYFWADQEFNADGIDIGTAPPEPASDIPDNPKLMLANSSCGMADFSCNVCSLGGGLASCAEIQQLQKFYGDAFYDLPGFDNEMARAEARHHSIYFEGYDPALHRLAATVTVTRNDGSVEVLKNPTLDQYQRLQTEMQEYYQAAYQTGYLPDTGVVDLEHNTVTIFGGAEYFIDPQNPGPTEAQRKCDDKLARIFGDENAVAAGSGFEPPHMPGKENEFRGGRGGHLNNAMHLYGSENGYGEGGVYIPAGGRYIGKNPYSNEDSYMFYYSRLGNARNVTLFTAHVANFQPPRGVTKGRTRIGDIGGEGGRSPDDPKNPFNQGPYIHAHLAIHQGRGYTGKRLSFFNVFCK